MIALAKEPRAANEIYCVANAAAPTVSELAQHIGRVTGHPVRRLRLPKFLWAAARASACNRVLFVLTPGRLKLPLWRLSLIVDDGFWFDTTKLQSVWRQPPKDLDASLAEILK